MTLIKNGQGRAGNTAGNNSGESSGDSAGALARRKFAAQCGMDEDDPMLPLLQGNAQLEMKVEQWSTAILELAALARQQNQAMQETSQNSLRLASALSSFEQESVQLRALIKQLGGSLTDSKSGSGKSPEGLNQNALQTLLPLLKAIKDDIASMEASIEVNDRGRDTNSSGGWRDYVVGAQAVMAVVMLLGGCWVYNQLNDQQFLLWKQSSWALTKLERIEKALGVQPDK
jgi:hypothetical protein